MYLFTCMPCVDCLHETWILYPHSWKASYARVLQGVNTRVVNCVAISGHMVSLLFGGALSLVQYVLYLPPLCLCSPRSAKILKVLWSFLLCPPIFFWVCSEHLQPPPTFLWYSMSHIHSVPLYLDLNTHCRYCVCIFFFFMKNTLNMNWLLWDR